MAPPWVTATRPVVDLVGVAQATGAPQVVSARAVLVRAVLSLGALIRAKLARPVLDQAESAQGVSRRVLSARAQMLWLAAAVVLVVRATSSAVGARALVQRLEDQEVASQMIQHRTSRMAI